MTRSKQRFINFSIALISVCICLYICNWMLAKLNPPKKTARTTAERLILTNPYFATYSPEEIDLSLPLYTEAQGQECVNVIRQPGMHYSPYFGWNTQQLDLNCAKQHFAKSGTKVIYFGGSAMENFEAPNYLTKIDNYINQLKPDLISLNLAESGGRSTNNLVRIVVEAMNLPADYWIFLDGFNEFNSIKYGGDHKEDFYWTATVNSRIHTPMRYVVDSIISKSPIMEKIFYSTGLVKTPRRRTTSVSESEIFAAADFYVENVKKISLICEAKKVKCLFFLQPYLVEASLSTQILDQGYTRILAQLEGQVIDLRPQLAGQNDAYVDDIHYNKKGSALVAKAIVEHLTL